jgi:hypothetical protein
MKNMLEKLSWERRKERYRILALTKTSVVVTTLNTLTNQQKKYIFSR